MNSYVSIVTDNIESKVKISNITLHEVGESQIADAFIIAVASVGLSQEEVVNHIIKKYSTADVR